MSFKTKVNNPLQAPSWPHSQQMTERKDWLSQGTQLLAAPPALHPQGHFPLIWDQRSPPGSSAHLLLDQAPHCLQPHSQFAFQDFLHSPLAQSGSKGSKGGVSGCPQPFGQLEETHEQRASCLTPSWASGPQRWSLFGEGKEAERETPPRPPLTHKLNPNKQQPLLRAFIPNRPPSCFSQTPSEQPARTSTPSRPLPVSALCPLASSQLKLAPLRHHRLPDPTSASNSPRT